MKQIHNFHDAVLNATGKAFFKKRRRKIVWKLLGIVSLPLLLSFPSLLCLFIAIFHQSTRCLWTFPPFLIT